MKLPSFVFSCFFISLAGAKAATMVLSTTAPTGTILASSPLGADGNERDLRFFTEGADRDLGQTFIVTTAGSLASVTVKLDQTPNTTTSAVIGNTSGGVYTNGVSGAAATITLYSVAGSLHALD